jgi:hypothetical protein
MHLSESGRLRQSAGLSKIFWRQDSRNGDLRSKKKFWNCRSVQWYFIDEKLFYLNFEPKTNSKKCKFYFDRSA